MAGRPTKWRHGKKCQCLDCTWKRAAMWERRAREMGTPKEEPSMDRLIPVRAHWRQSSTYLTKSDPSLAQVVRDIVREMQSRKGRRKAG